jgi:NAD(P)-dependent dehydrogenase (short-subunit alcohol dehydrogenase family)
MAVIVVTGANSGIGRATAVHLAAAGHTVHGAMRDLGKGAKLQDEATAAGTTVAPLELDVSDDGSVRRGIQAVLDAEGRIDVLVNNAGLGYNKVVEEIDIDEGKQVFDVNYWGVVRCTQAVLPSMREQGSGTIVNVSSVAGRLAAIAQAVYASSKWALECLSENLAQELAPFGIRVKVIEPGVTRTALLAKHQELHPDSPYADAYRRMFAFYATGIEANVRPSAVAEVVQQAIDDDSARLRYVCAYAGDELAGGREGVSDEDWLALGAAASDDEYFDRFEQAFGLDIRAGDFRTDEQRAAGL